MLSVVAMIPPVVSSVVESVGDYYSTARVLGLPTPPIHALNRGIMVEGVASMLSGMYGVGHATTSFSTVIGYIAFSGVSNLG